MAASTGRLAVGMPNCERECVSELQHLWLFWGGMENKCKSHGCGVFHHVEPVQPFSLIHTPSEPCSLAGSRRTPRREGLARRAGGVLHHYHHHHRLLLLVLLLLSKIARTCKDGGGNPCGRSWHADEHTVKMDSQANKADSPPLIRGRTP